MAKILAFAGSSRIDSYNKKLVRIAARGAEEAGATVKVIDLADYPMPLYNADLEREEGIPGNARKFKQLLIEHDAFLIASPEYNSAFSPLLVNSIDWASRPEGKGEPPLVAYSGKAAAIMAAAPGALGGLRGLVFLRMLLSNLRIMVLPEQKAISSAARAFDEEGRLLDENAEKAVLGIGAALAGVASKLSL